MDNQHKLIKGYRDLSVDEIAAMNKVKEAGIVLGAIVDELREMQVDQRWVSIGETALQTGIMALVRSIAQPSTF